MKFRKFFSLSVLMALSLGVFAASPAAADSSGDSGGATQSTSSEAPTSKGLNPNPDEIEDGSVSTKINNDGPVEGSVTGKKLDTSGLDINVYKLPEGNKVKAKCETQCRSITASPAFLEITPQEVENSTWRKFRIINNGYKPMNVKIFATQFSQQANGNVVLSDASGDETNSASWIQLYPDQLTLQPDEYQNVYIAVDAPDEAPAGDQNVSIVFRDPGAEKKGAINVAMQIGTKIFIQVPGDVERRIIFNGADSTIPEANQVHKFLGISQSSSKYTFDFTLENKGSVHEDFVQDNRIKGVVSGWQLFSPMSDTYLQAPEFIIARDSTRNLSWDWSADYTKAWDKNYADEHGLKISNPPVFCFCSATFKAFDGNGNVAIYDVSFIIFPIWQTIVALVVLGLLILWLIVRRRKSKRLKKELEELRNYRAAKINKDVSLAGTVDEVSNVSNLSNDDEPEIEDPSTGEPSSNSPPPERNRHRRE